MRTRMMFGALAAAVLFLLATPQPGAAQDNKSLEERVAELEKKVQKLEEYIAKLEAEKKLADVEQLLGSMRDQARVQHAKMGSYPRDLVATCGVAKDELSSETHTVRDEVFFVIENRRSRERSAALVADPKEKGGKYGVLTFVWGWGGGTLKWYDTEAAMKEGNPNIKFEDKSTTSKEAPDPFLLYKKKGRKWKHKSVTKLEGMDDMVSFHEYEVTEVGEDYAKFTFLMLDKDGKPTPGMEPSETRLEFRMWDNHNDDPYEDPAAVKTVEETITVKAGEFNCTRFDQRGTKSWTSVKYPGLLVKLTTEQTEMELVEFTE